MSPDADLDRNMRGRHCMLQKARLWGCQLLEFTSHLKPMLELSQEAWDQDNILCVAIQIQELNK